jgi:hypothetical protein
MANGSALSASQVKEALAYNLARHPAGLLGTIRGTLGLAITAPLDDAFVRAVADWQEANVGTGAGDGKIGPRTEAFMNLVHPRAIAATTAAKQIQLQGGILFDSWGNDYRDNNGDGVVDGPRERAADGAHFGGLFGEFGVQAGTYSGQGWDFLPPGPPVVVRSTRRIKGPFKYRVCADVVSAAYKAAGIMGAQRSTLFIHEEFKKKGYVFRRTDGYPTEYLPGDFIHTLAGAEGHSGIVMQREPTRGGSHPPLVMQLPGPSTQLSDGTYDPESTNDVTIERWSIWRTTQVHSDFQLLGRILHSKLTA